MQNFLGIISVFKRRKGNVFISIFLQLSIDITSVRVQLIIIFEIEAKDIQPILELAVFPEELVIEEALSFELKMKCPYFGDNYATKYKNDIGLGVEMIIK